VKEYPFITHQPIRYSEEEMVQASKDFYAFMDKRRSVRTYADKPVPKEIIENIIKTASTAPSGAHKQPWTFCVVANPDIKREIRIAAEKEEKESYERRMPDAWKEDIVPLGTDWHKPFLETAPYLIIVFKRAYEIHEGNKKNNYYVNESVGLAAGFLIAAIHNAGLVTLTHTPSPMNFLQKILKRPENERPFLLLPVGYAADEVSVPDLDRKPLDQVMVEY